MTKTFLGIAASAMFYTSLTTSAGAQTYLLPDNTMRDPRMAVIRKKLQSDHGSIRPLTTYTDTDVNRSWNEQGFFFSTLQNLLLEAGAEPVRSERDAQFKLYLSSNGRLDPGSNLIIETLTLTLTDLRARGGGQLIMSSTSTLQCPDTRVRKYLSLVCPVNTEILVETFLRLR